MTETATALANRYGAQTKKRFDKLMGIILAVLIATVMGGFAVIFGLKSGADGINVRDISHTIENKNSATITFELTAPKNSRVSCEMQALSKSYAPLGYAIVTLPAADKQVRQFTHSLRTINEATTITVESCWLIQN